MTYEKYFNIDPDFFPVVNEDVMKNNPALWKKFYPHQSFVNLLDNTIKVLERKEKKNIWVEGSYGTGKSHAVLTLTALLKATKEEVEAYFDNFIYYTQKYGFTNDLKNRLLSVKQAGEILVVNDYSASKIFSDRDLFVSMEEKIVFALKQSNIDYKTNSYKDGIIKYLSENKPVFEACLSNSDIDELKGETVDSIIHSLNTYDTNATIDLLNNLDKIANKYNILAFSLDSQIIRNWIKEIIQNNNLKALVFIWDEFSEYFQNNATKLTGFQDLLELSSTTPFCFIPVTHRSADVSLNDTESKKKIKDRFINPICRIDLPDNIAFELMAKAMETTSDQAIKKEWDKTKADLINRTKESRDYISKQSNIKEEHLKDILPIHPYAACILKHITTYFKSNQRSMFEFIKSSKDKDLQGFSWFINTIDPDKNDPLLTTDMLWNYFYDNGKNDLPDNIRRILDIYSNRKDEINLEQARVLKTILLLESINNASGMSVEIFKPNTKNITLAFEGTDLDTKAISIANTLCKQQIISCRQIDNTANNLYQVLFMNTDTNEIDKVKNQLNSETTISSILENNPPTIIDLPHNLQHRFDINYIGLKDFATEVYREIDNYTNTRIFKVFVCLSRNQSEYNKIDSKIKETLKKYTQTDTIFINCRQSLSDDDFNNYINHRAQGEYFLNQNQNQSKIENKAAENIITSWYNKIREDQFVLYNKDNMQGDTLNTASYVNNKLSHILTKKYPLSLETKFPSKVAWWTKTNFKSIAEQGLTSDPAKGIFNVKLENNKNIKEILSYAWQEPNYWINRQIETLSKIKLSVEKLIQDRLNDKGRISFDDIYDLLKESPYGFVASNFTAFILGIVLKEYVNNSQYSHSDSNGHSVDLTQDILTNDIKQLLDQDTKTDNSYTSRYITRVSKEQKAFIEGTANAFDLNKSLMGTTDNAREQIRNYMQYKLYLPLWVLNNILDKVELKTDKKTIKDLLLQYQNFVNDSSQEINNNEASTNIGKIFLANTDAPQDLENLCTKENCIAAMHWYLNQYDNNKLHKLSNQFEDKNQCITDIKEKLKEKPDSNWLWDEKTFQLTIDLVTTEYSIIEKTNELLGERTTTCDEAINIWKKEVDKFRMPFSLIKSYAKGVEDLLSILNKIKSSKALQDSYKANFFSIINRCGEEFTNLTPSILFKQACRTKLKDLSDNDIDKIFAQLSDDCFLWSNDSYNYDIDKKIQDYKANLNSTKLKQLWKQKTNTNDPIDWSNIYHMPISVMIDNKDEDQASKVFDIIVNTSNNSEEQINWAINYLNNWSYWDKLQDKEQRDKQFRALILEEYSYVVDNLDKLKDYLTETISSEPYYWQGRQELKEKIKQYAKDQYTDKYCQRALDSVDNLSSQELKARIKELIKDDIHIGIAFIK